MPTYLSLDLFLYVDVTYLPIVGRRRKKKCKIVRINSSCKNHKSLSLHFTCTAFVRYNRNYK